MIVIQAYDEGLAGVRAANPAVHLSVARDSSVADERVLIVDYPAPTDDPAGRDVQCAAENQDWTGGRAIHFRSSRPFPQAFVVVPGSESCRIHGVDGAEGRFLAAGSDSARRDSSESFLSTSRRQDRSANRRERREGHRVPPQDETSGRLAIGKFVVTK